MIKYTSKILNKLNFYLLFPLSSKSTFNKTQQHLNETSLIIPQNLIQKKQKNIVIVSIPNRKISPQGVRHAELTKKLRSCCCIYESYTLIKQNFEQFQKIGLTLLFDFLNLNQIQIRGIKSKSLLIQLGRLLNQFENLSIYNLITKISIMQKLKPFLTEKQDKLFLDENIKKSVKQIQQKLEQDNEKQICVGDVINILSVFRIQTHETLLRKSLQLLDKMIITKIDHYIKNKKLCMILINQFQYIQWYDLKKFKNIIRFWTYDFHLDHTFWEFSEISQILQTIAVLKLHKVGEKKIPKIIKQSIQILKHNHHKLSIRSIVGLIKLTTLLPSDFIAQFKQIMINRYLQFSQQAQKAIIFPFQAFSLKQVEKVLGNDKPWVKNIIWKNLIYYCELEEIKLLMRGNILNLIQDIIQQAYKQVSENNQTKQQYQIENENDITRLGHLVVYYVSKKDQNNLNKLNKILRAGFNKINLKKLLKQASFILYFNFFLIFHKQPIIHDIFKQFCQVLYTRKQRNKYDSYLKNCLKVIKNFIHFDNKYIQKSIKMMIQLICFPKLNNNPNENLDTKQQLTKFNFKTDLFIILYLANGKQDLSPQFTQIKSKIMKKMTTFEELQILVEYFIQERDQTFKAFLEISQLIIHSSHLQISPHQNRNNKVLFLLLYLLEEAKIIENKRGRIQSSVVSFLNRYENKIQFPQKGCLDNIHQINRVLNRFKQHDQINKFSYKLYSQTLLSLYEQIQKQQFVLQSNSSRTIVQFIMKLQSVFDMKTAISQQKIMILEKVYAIFKKLIKLDDGIYLKVKLFQFVCMYKQIINVSQQLQQGYSIQFENLLDKIGQKATNLPEVLLTICKLQCLGLIEISEQKLVEYQAILKQSVNKKKLTLFSLHNIIISIFYSAKLYNLDNLRIKFNKTITPIIIQAMPMYVEINSPVILKNFIEYFKLMNNISLAYPLINHLVALYLTPKILIQLFQLLPFNSLPKQILNILMGKIVNLLHLYDANSINLIYLLERIFYQNPSQYQMVYEQVWKVANENMYKNIKNLQEKTKTKRVSFDQKKFLLGPILFYMFACIKAQKVEGNVNFNILLQFLKQNQQKFLLVYKSPIYKSIVLFLVLYANFTLNKNTNNKILNPLILSEYKKIIHNLRSIDLENQLRQNKIQFYFNYEINNFTIPYYLPGQTTIILNNNLYKNIQSNSQKKINGYGKFSQEVYKVIFPKCKILVEENFKIHTTLKNNQ